jgi:fumarate hydratase, class II
MNWNEVIANRAKEILGQNTRGTKSPVHPNEQVNIQQSSDDVFPSAVHIAAVTAIVRTLIPRLQGLLDALERKEKAFSRMVKLGRTPLNDALPMTLGQEFSG